jgi:hypothetical protein
VLEKSIAAEATAAAQDNATPFHLIGAMEHHNQLSASNVIVENRNHHHNHHHRLSPFNAMQDTHTEAGFTIEQLLYSYQM